MAEAKDPASSKQKMYDENDEFEIFAVELMTNLMKHFNDANYVVMPTLPRSSKHYSVTILKSVALVWRFTHENHCKRFRMAFPILCNRRTLFGYAIYQATTLFDKMISYAQFVFLAAYCYELCCFLCRNGLEEYIYVSYTLFTTIWKDRYAQKFRNAGGWKYLEKALEPFAIVHDAAEEIFLPGYPLKEEDLLKALKEYENLAKERRDRGEEPLRQEDENLAEDLDEETRRRMVTRKDWKLLYFYYVRTSEMMRVDDGLEEALNEKLIDYLKYQEIKKRIQIRRAALLKSDALCDEALLGTVNVPRSEDKTCELPSGDASMDSCRLSLESCSIHGVEENVGDDGEDVGIEKGPTAETGAKPKKKKSGAKGGKSPQKQAPTVPATSCGTKPKKNTNKSESSNQVEKMKQPHSSKSPTKKPAGDKQGSKSAKDEGKSG